MNVAEKTGAVITGGDFQGLGVLRTLARKGIPVVLLDSDHCIGRFSRYKKRFYKSPRPSDEGRYVEFLVGLAEREDLRGWVLFPNSDGAVYVLSKYRDVLKNYYRVTTAGWEVIQHVYIKGKTYRLAEVHGIQIPRTYYPENLFHLLDMDLKYPLVIKPSIRDHFYCRVRIKAFRVNNRAELIETYTRVSSVIDPSEVLVQEFIPGGPSQLYSYCPFFKDGKTVSGIAARRLRQHPMDFGHATTYAEVVEIPEIRSIAEKFLRLIGFYGICEVEFMKDPRSGEFKLIEVNPRVWGWHTLAIAAGADLPHMLYQDMVGEQVAVGPPPNGGTKWLRAVTDVPTAIKEIIRGNMKLVDYLRTLKGKKEFAVFALDDPLPSIAELAMLPYLWVKRGF